MKVKSWDQFYRSPKTFGDMIRWAATHSGLVSDLARHESVLEVGTGTGMLSGFVSRFSRLTVSLDNNLSVIRTARSFTDGVGAHVAMIQGDAFALPFPDRSFGSAFSQGLLEHFSDADIVRLIEEQLRVASVAYASVPGLFYPHVWRFGPGLVGNERFMGIGRWRRILGAFQVDGSYYPDFKIATLAGVTVPWPAHILLKVSRCE